MNPADFETYEVRPTSGERFALCTSCSAGFYRERAYFHAVDLEDAIEQAADLMARWFRPRVIRSIDFRSMNGRRYAILHGQEVTPESDLLSPGLPAMIARAACDGFAMAVDA